MSDPASLVDDLRAHAALCEEMVALVEEEALALRAPQSGRWHFRDAERRALLPRLDESIARLRRHRGNAGATCRPLPAETHRWLQRGQNALLRAVTLDRENEERLRARPWQAPDAAAPAQTAPAGHFVSGLYLRHRR